MNISAQEAITSIMASVDCPSREIIHDAISAAIDPQSQHLVVVNVGSNGIAKLRTVDDDGQLCSEWYDVLTAICETCKTVMDKYSRNGTTYRICDDCAAKLPDPLRDELWDTVGRYPRD